MCHAVVMECLIDVALPVVLSAPQMIGTRNV
ncbi:hypothetical protein Fuma_04670 [Fuerstiella marisgermanici]|uniref:Uncharacterized protein n=1 Tax=Fuerstiella marisgermanici TaxID=1891926 RepID=A0A1P8WLT0_9PLAN|nr:hypothetical protein Fuma_04670 [Fuerstiella marisgermanici]